MYIAALLVTLPSWLWISWITLNEQAHKDLNQKVYDDLSLFADSLNSELEKYRFIPKVLMLDASLVAQVSNPILATAGSQPNQHLTNISFAISTFKLHQRLPSYHFLTFFNMNLVNNTTF